MREDLLFNQSENTSIVSGFAYFEIQVIPCRFASHQNTLFKKSLLMHMTISGANRKNSNDYPFAVSLIADH